MRRRDLVLAVIATGAASQSIDQSRDYLQTVEWDRRLREFLKQMNKFIVSLNEGVFDAKQLKRVKSAWKRFEEVSGE